MTATTQHIAPEDIMALQDGELAAAEARAVAEHMETCVECGAIAVQFRETSRALAAWAVPSLPEALETVIREKSAKRIAQGEAKIPLQMGFRGGAWRWAIGGGCLYQRR